MDLVDDFSFSRQIAPTRDYHALKATANQRYLLAVLTHFQLQKLEPRALYLFEQQKRLGPVRWGQQANILVVAAAYLAAREHNEHLPLLQLAALTSLDYHALARAHRLVKQSSTLPTKDLDPGLFIEPNLLHLATLLRSCPNPPLSGSKLKKFWSKSNLIWLRSISLKEVRTLATGLLSFISDLSLVVGRAPEQVSCAVIIVALEGVARQPIPVISEMVDELSALLVVKPTTISERYRELKLALKDFAPRIPWLEKGELVKKSWVKYTDDIVKFRKELDLGKVEKEAGLQFEREMERGEESEILRGEEEEGEEEECFPDPLLARPSHARTLQVETSVPPHSHSPLTPSSPSQFPIASPVAGSSTLIPPVVAVTPIEPIIAAHVKASSKRPAEYMRGRAGSKKRIKTIADAACSLLVSFSSSSSIPTPIESNSIDPSKKPETLFAPHSLEAIQFRQQLLAGHNPTDIYEGSLEPVSHEDERHSSRLTKLLWIKKWEEICDEELFGPGEMEGFLRSDEEVEVMRGSEKFLEILERERVKGVIGTGEGVEGGDKLKRIKDGKGKGKSKPVGPRQSKNINYDHWERILEAESFAAAGGAQSAEGEGLEAIEREAIEGGYEME